MKIISPSIKSLLASGLCKNSKIEPNEKQCAKLVRQIIKETNRTALESLLDDNQNFPNTIKWINSCYNFPKLQDIKMAALNELLDLFGVESVSYKLKNDNEVYSFDYLNTGETYSATIIRFPSGHYVISSWCDEVERLERKGAQTGDYTTLKYS